MVRMLQHRLAHWLGWNLGWPVLWHNARRLRYTGFRCATCRALQDVKEH